MSWSPEIVVLFGGMAIASTTDLMQGKIPNRLTGPMMVVGILLGTISGSPLGSILGLLLAFAIHFPLWVVRVEKAGDAKLIMGLGALMGWELVVETTLWCAVFYLPVGLIFLATQGNLLNIIKQFLWMADKARGVEAGEAPPTTLLRTAPLIAVATVMAVLTDWLDFV